MTRMTYRKSEGVKLGQIVAKDLRKRLKLVSKPESQRVAPQVQLELEGKALTDEGLGELVEGLHDATKAVDGIITTRLQFWDLSRNNLTAKSLPHLTKALKAVRFDLEALNLSQNAIDVTEESDLIHWEDFLKSLGACKHLSQVIFSGNAIGGRQAMEVFARVAIYYKLLDKTKDNDEVSEQLQALQIRDSNKRLAVIADTGKALHPVVTSQCLLSIRFWLLDNISLTDEGALFLSYVVVRHDWIHNGPLSTGGSHTMVKEEQDGLKCFPNDSTTSVGAKLLTLAKEVKEHELVDKDTGADGTALLSTLLSRYEKTDLGSVGAKSKPQTHQTTTQGPDIYQTPSRSTSHTYVYSSAVEELESLRKKIQRGIIEKHGASKVDLWRAALKLLSNVRGVIIEPLVFPTSAIWNNNTRSQLPTNRYSEKVVDSLWPKLPSKGPRTASAREESPPCTGKTGYLDCRHNWSKIPNAVSPLTAPSEHSSGRGWTETASIEQISLSSTSSTSPTLPVEVWEKILLKVSDPQNLLSERQREAIIQWGKSRATLTAEMGSIGKLDSVQTWRVLDAMHCLSYDLRE